MARTADTPTYCARRTCGALSAKAQGDPLRVGACHCRDCQRDHGAPFYAAAIFPAAAVTITGPSLTHRGRASCATCGASVFARTDDEVELHLGAMDPEHGLIPTYECWTCRRHPWLHPIAGAAQFDRDR